MKFFSKNLASPLTGVKKIIMVALLVALSGCATVKPVSEQSTAELCQRLGYMGHKDQLDSAESDVIANELANRWNSKRFGITEPQCKSYMQAGVKLAIQDEQRPAAPVMDYAMMGAIMGMNQPQQMDSYQQQQIQQMQQMNNTMQSMRMDQQMQQFKADNAATLERYGY